jgi:hypothetical protein
MALVVDLALQIVYKKLSAHATRLSGGGSHTLTLTSSRLGRNHGSGTSARAMAPTRCSWRSPLRCAVLRISSCVAASTRSTCRGTLEHSRPHSRKNNTDCAIGVAYCAVLYTSRALLVGTLRCTTVARSAHCRLCALREMCLRA